ncbi:hypothetical protein HWB51_gp096 [Mycobacterium phage Cuke]|uniref:Uncharacterized protein n=1 Tax=Mycobacterium phage Cuke TaxID=2079417 RepID=A0A2L1IX20_9CAUD|nr:hypothetical protein HWB51_gp096 [Mycobacterium phage Cuke]AVD99716.1 hypothetical protein SEA_CUKE_100 [Mycobacterium phage Cuke]
MIFYAFHRSMQEVKTVASLGIKQIQRFKWEWAVVLDVVDSEGDSWVERQIFQTRRGARQYKSNLLLDADPFLSKTDVKNVKLQRRLVSVDWQDYSDSFSYNAKGNGNGR